LYIIIYETFFRLIKIMFLNIHHLCLKKHKNISVLFSINIAKTWANFNLRKIMLINHTLFMYRFFPSSFLFTKVMETLSPLADLLQDFLPISADKVELGPNDLLQSLIFRMKNSYSENEWNWTRHTVNRIYKSFLSL